MGVRSAVCARDHSRARPRSLVLAENAWLCLGLGCDARAAALQFLEPRPRPRAASPPRLHFRYYCQVPLAVSALLSVTTNSSSFALFSLRRGFLQSLPLPAGSRSAEPLEIEGFTVKMKISLQIILADARSPGRGRPPQPFDKHISGGFRVSIISSRRAKVNTVTARGRVQSNYHARPGQARRGGGSPRRVRALLPLLKAWGSRSYHSELGGRPRSRQQGPTTQGDPAAQATGFWPRNFPFSGV